MDCMHRMKAMHSEVLIIEKYLTPRSFKKQKNHYYFTAISRPFQRILPRLKLKNEFSPMVMA